MPRCFTVLLFLIASIPALAQTKGDIPKGRSAPLEMVETFCFAWDALREQVPGAMEVAQSCLDFPPEVSAIEKSKLVSIFGEVMDILSPPFINAGASRQGKTATLYNDKDIQLILEQGNDGFWKLSRASIAALPAIHRKIIEKNQALMSQRMQLTDGLGDPTELFNTFLIRAIAGDFETAAQCLDLRGISPEKRRSDGQKLAWLLAASIQRLGYVHTQDIPVEPMRPPYAWYSGPEGIVVSERVHLENSSDRWLYSQATVSQIEKLWNAVKDRPIHDKWKILGYVVKDPDLTAVNIEPPKGLAREFTSPRRVLQGFLKLMDDAEHNDMLLEKAIEFLDLSGYSEEEKTRLGGKLAEKLEILLRKIKPAISELDDHYTAPMVTLGEKNLKVNLARRADGRWGISKDSVVRIPGMFDALTPQEKGQGDHLSGHSSPRETFSTFLRAVNDGRLAEAADCLDLTDLPLSARDEIGPILAIKLKAIIDRIGRVYFHEIPSDSDGPRYLWHRGTLGKILLAKRQDLPAQGWRFTNSTVAQIDAGIQKMIALPIDQTLVGFDNIVTGYSWWLAPGLRMRQLIPASLTRSFGPLEAWQWLGAFLLAAILYLFTTTLKYTLDPWVETTLGFREPDIRILANSCLRPLNLFLTTWLGLKLLLLLDLPMGISATLFSIDNLVFGLVAVWAGFGIIDLVLLWSENSRQLGEVRGFQDLLLPFFSNLVKSFLVIGSILYLISCFDDGTLMGRFLAGLGVAGLAISLAAQDSLKNIFATMLLIGDRSFKVGDLIQLGSIEGTVQTVGFRSTRLKTKEDSILIVPNANLAGGTIDNLGLRTHRRVQGSITLAPSSRPDTVMELRNFMDQWAASREGHDVSRCEVVIQGFNDRGIEVRFTAYVLGKGHQANEFRTQASMALLDQATHLGLTVV